MLESLDDICLYDFYQKLLEMPYGANSTEATLIIFLYLTCRYHEIDIYRNGELVELSSFALAKNSLSKNKALTKNVWQNVYFRKAIRDDAKWNSLIKAWHEDVDILKLVEHKKEADTLIENNISIPIHLSNAHAECLTRSKQAEQLYFKWNTESSLISKEIETKMNQERIRTTLIIYVDKYLSLYNDTIVKGTKLRPQMKFPKEIVEAADEFKSDVRSYIEFGLDSWTKDHPLVYDCAKDDFDKACKDYEMMVRYLNVADLTLVANDLANDLAEIKEKRKVLLEFSSINNKAKQEYKSVQENISLGLFSSAQVVSSVDRLKLIMKTLDNFPVKKLSLIPEYSFESLKADVQSSISYLNNLGSQKDKDFEALFGYEITSVDDLETIIGITSDLVTFYKGLGDIKNDNLADAQLMNKEATLLKASYYEMKSAGLSVFSLNTIAEEQKDKIKKELYDDAIFDDDEIIDSFKAYFESILQEKSEGWVDKVRKNLDSTSSVNEIDKILFSIEEAPTYTKGLVDQEMLDIKNAALKRKANMKMDYLKSLFNELSSEDKDLFISWCKDQNR